MLRICSTPLITTALLVCADYLLRLRIMDSESDIRAQKLRIDLQEQRIDGLERALVQERHRIDALQQSIGDAGTRAAAGGLR